MRLSPRLVVPLLATFSVWPGVAATQEARITAIENVHVLTMTDAGALERQTVIVENDRIVSLTQRGQVPSGARVIDGSNMTLLPGLADMHVHYRFADQGPLFLANGVTTVRDTWGRTFSFSGDALAKAGVLAGPHVYASGPLMDGENPAWPGSLVVTSPDEARGAVAAAAVAGFRAVKLYNGLDEQTFRAAVATAHEFDMQVWAHTPTALTYDDMLALGVDSLEHLWRTQYALMDARPDPALPPLYQGVFGWARVDDARMSDLARRTAEAGLWNVPTLTIHTQLFENAANAEEFFSRPTMKYVGQAVIQMWRGSAGADGPGGRGNEGGARRP